MDKNELERRLEAAEKQNIELQDEIKNLKAQLAKVQDEQEIPDFPNFKCGESYWTMFDNFALSDERIAFVRDATEYNMFHTEAYAQEFANKCKLIAMMLHCKWYLDRDALHTSEKTWLYGICYDKEEKKFVYASYCSCEPCVVTFRTEEAAQKCADWLNEHWKEESLNLQLQILIRLLLWTIAFSHIVMIAAHFLLRQDAVMKQSNGSTMMKHGAFLTTEVIAMPKIDLLPCPFCGRVVESKQYDCTATITDKEFHPEYTTYSTTVDSDGNRHRHSHHHPAEYYIYYTVIFDGGTYAGNKDKVSDRYYYKHNSGDKVQAIFIQQWRADNSETYEIKLVG